MDRSGKPHLQRLGRSEAGPSHHHAPGARPVHLISQPSPQRLGKSKEALCIWDPYYCNGKTKVRPVQGGEERERDEKECVRECVYVCVSVCMCV